MAEFHRQAEALQIEIRYFSDLLPYVSGEFFNFSNLFTVESGYSKPFLQFIAETLKNLARHRQGLDHKLIIVDLDETLWPGILAEEGPRRKDIDDALFRATMSVQKKLKALKAHGFLLALCSKNDPRDVEEFFNATPMPLGLKDFICVECSWGPKDVSVQKIKERLGFSEKQIAFLDNSSFERELIKKNFPGVFVPDLSPSYFQRRSQLEGWFGSWHPFATKQDQGRTESYQTNILREDLKLRTSNLEEWILSLGPSLTRQGIVDDLKDRALQLLQRTNQFNCFPETPVLLPQNFENDLLYSYRDRLGDDGPIALVRTQIKEKDLLITQFVLSCRVFGRTIEDAILRDVFQHAQDLGLKDVRILFKSSDRNKVARDFIFSDRFVACGTNEYKLKSPRKTLIPMKGHNV